MITRSDLSRNLARTVGCALAWLALLAAGVSAQGQDVAGNAPVSRSTDDRASVSARLNFDRVQPGQQAVVAIVLDIQEGFHAQSNKPIQDFLIPFSLTALVAEPGAAFEPIYPEGHIENYPALVMPGDKGDLSVYTGRAIAYIPVEVAAHAKPGSTFTVRGQATYQICDAQSCFQPETKQWQVQVPVVAAGEMVSAANEELFAGYNPEAHPSPLDDGRSVTPAENGSATVADSVIADIVGGDATRWSAGWAFLMALIAGLIFNIMPCVLPVLPIKAWGFYEVANHDRRKSFLLGLVFAAGLISVFAALGILILPLQLIAWGSLFSSPWFVWPLVLLLVILGLGLFGAFTTTLPGSVYALAPRHDTVGGNYALGALTAVLATPCTAPLLPGVLLWAAVQPAVIGVLSLVFVGVGMALPYLFLSLFPGLARRFPRTGPWPELFKQMMGFLMLAAAAYFAGGRLLGSPSFWWMPLGVVAIGCLYLVVRTAQLSDRALPVAIACTIAVVALAGGVAATPLAQVFSTRQQVAQSSHQFSRFEEEAFEAARAAGRPVLVKFTANWCLTCQVIERTVFTNPQVWDLLDQKNVAVFKVDLTNSGAPGESLLYKLNASGGIPLTAVWLPGREDPVIISSLYTSDQLLRLLETIPSAGDAAAE